MEPKPKPKCSNCNDTGFYDACCRPHLCSCEAGKAYEARHKQPVGLRVQQGAERARLPDPDHHAGEP